MTLGLNFRRLWAASTVSNLGDGIIYTAAPLLAASLTRDPFLVAFVMFMRGLPWLLFSLIGGAIADRVDRRRLMGVFNFVRAGALGFLGLAVLLGFANLPLLYATFFVIGASETFFDTASQTILPQVVAREDFDKANGRLEGARIVTNDLAGPSLGGLLFAVAAAIPFLLNAGAFAAAAALILGLRGNFSEARPESPGSAVGPTVASILADIREGLAWLANNRLLLLLAIMLAVAGFVDEAAFAIFVLFTQDILGLAPAFYGLLLASSAVGGVLGSVVMDGLGRRLESGGTVLLSLSAGALSYVGIALAAFSPAGVAIVAVMLVVNGFHLASWNIATLSLRQRLVPDHLLGRVNSAYRFVGMVGLTAGTLVGGVSRLRLRPSGPLLARRRVADLANLHRTRSSQERLFHRTVVKSSRHPLPK